MANNNLLAIVTMLLLIGSPGHSQSQPTIEELRTIEGLIGTADWRALYTYIEANPRLSTGNSPLAVELRSFKGEVEKGQLNSFNARTGRNSDGSNSRNNSNSNIY